MDVQMPELYGDDVAAVLRHVRGTRARIILFSNLPPEELSQRAAEAGLDGFITKQQGMDALVSQVRELLT
jgi:DNA-binding NarL/FixJ family response regulator